MEVGTGPAVGTWGSGATAFNFLTPLDVKIVRKNARQVRDEGNQDDAGRQEEGRFC
jgi:hypothetical protein